MLGTQQYRRLTLRSLLLSDGKFHFHGHRVCDKALSLALHFSSNMQVSVRKKCWIVKSQRKILELKSASHAPATTLLVLDEESLSRLLLQDLASRSVRGCQIWLSCKHRSFSKQDVYKCFWLEHVRLHDDNPLSSPYFLQILHQHWTTIKSESTAG